MLVVQICASMDEMHPFSVLCTLLSNFSHCLEVKVCTCTYSKPSFYYVYARMGSISGEIWANFDPPLLTLQLSSLSNWVDLLTWRWVLGLVGPYLISSVVC